MRTKGVNIEHSDRQDHSVLKDALKMAFGTMTSRVLGQLRESLLAYYFDKRITDAWNAAFRVPNLFRRLLGEGSLSVSFIPVFVDAHIESHEKAQNLVNSAYTFLLLILGCLTTFGVLHPEPLLNSLLDSSFIADQEKYLLTVRMAKIMFSFVFFVSSYAFSMGVLNALGQFALPAIAPTFWNLSMIISTLVPDSWFSVRGDQLAFGVLAGGAMQALILVPSLIKSGYLPKLSFNFRNPDFIRVLRNMGPGLLGMGLLQFTTLINLRFSSSLEEGTISYINYVDRLIELPLSLISVSLGTALLPALANLMSRNERKKFSETTRHYLELNLIMTMAAATGLYVLAEPIVSLLFGRGRFSPIDVQATANILKTYCWIMIFSSGVRVLTPAYYAVKNTWFPALVSCICVMTHLILAPQLMAIFQVRGLMMSTIIGAVLNLSLLLIFYRRFVSEFEYFKFFKSVAIFSLLAAVTGSAAHLFYLFQDYLPEGTFYLLINVLVTIGFSISAFVASGYLLKVRAVYEVLDKILHKLKLRQ